MRRSRDTGSVCNCDGSTTSACTLRIRTAMAVANMGDAMQGVFVLTGTALVLAGLNGSRSLVIVGAGVIVLALVGRVLGRNANQT